MNQIRRCSRPGCGQVAVATLTYAYAHSTAYVGPLIANSDPHSWDLCERHAAKITAPKGWEMVRVDAPEIGEDDLTALAEAVREQGRLQSGLLQEAQLNQSPGAELAPHHPAKRSKAKAAEKAQRRAHLSLVPDAEDTSSDAD
ncbi:DUF3499 domain-containing protein [Corynebacterium sp. ES2794-CONJ1]|uniref:DUF3499 domain-containing protein n=1 Tax=Corynebacterium sp. ES2794-CONJ1 TaxID=2980553 RepID=UPI0021DB2233|nr:DUF3499 domain-containing protein [Corynebacterium sp. ES2794-CONJ1]MCU9518789.1 DUF3499 domain-containing protein [Corynebacterium sp. ES2794-CONJ1]